MTNLSILTLSQLPEPLLTFDLYNSFIGVGKSIQHLSERELTPDTNEIMDIIDSLQKLLQKLPLYCYSTLQHLISHLQKWGCSNIVSNPPSRFLLTIQESLLDVVSPLPSQSLREWGKQDVPQQFGYSVRANTIAPSCVYGHANDCPVGDQLSGCTCWVPHHAPWQDLWSSATIQYAPSPSPHRTSSRHPSQGFLCPRWGSLRRLGTWNLLQRASTLTRSKYSREKTFTLTETCCCIQVCGIFTMQHSDQ